MKNSLVKILFFSLLLVALSTTGTYLYITGGSTAIVITLAVTLLVIILLLVQLFEKSNRTLAFFLNAVRNNDTTLIFSTKQGTSGEKKYHDALNQLNEMIQKTKILSEAKEHYFHAIINQSSTGLIVRDSATKIKFANSALLNLCQLPTLYHIDQLDRVSAQFKKTISTIAVGEEVLQNIQIFNQKQQLSIQASELKLQKRSYTLISVRNLQTELDHNELESWIKLIRVLTHEIMNSLAPITSVSQTLCEAYKTEDLDEATLQLTRSGIALIHEQSTGLTRFVNSYRSLTRIPNPDIVDISAQELLQKWQELAQEISPDHLKIEATIEHEELYIQSDVQMLTRVVSNLMKNGIEALSETENPKIVIRIKAPATIEIANNGPVISDDVLENIWVPFFTTKEGGSGIGLSLCKQIVKKLNGIIEVTTSEKETVFRIKLSELKR